MAEDEAAEVTVMVLECYREGLATILRILMSHSKFQMRYGKGRGLEPKILIKKKISRWILKH